MFPEIDGLARHIEWLNTLAPDEDVAGADEMRAPQEGLARPDAFAIAHVIEERPAEESVSNGDGPLAPDAVAARLEVSLASVYRWISAGDLKAVRVGPKLFRIMPEDFAAFLAAGGVPTKSRADSGR